MFRTPFELFLDVCEAQATEFNADIAKDAMSQDPELMYETLVTRDSAALAVTLAGDYIRTGNADLIAKNPVMPPEYLLEDVGTRTLTGIVNASVGAPVEKPDTLIHDCISSPADVCADAEPRFLKTIADAGDGTLEKECQVIVDNNGDPLFLRKTLGARSALALVDYMIAGIPYPAGSILRLNLSTRASWPHQARDRRDNVRVLHKAHAVAGTFMRLSALNWPPADRRDRYPMPYAERYLKKEHPNAYDLLTQARFQEIQRRVANMVKEYVDA